MFGKKKKLPGCIGFVDFEHWYISLERQYGVKPDIKGWKAELEKSFEVEEIAVFGDFSNAGLRAELDKIRDVTPMVFDTKNPSEHYKKDFTDFIMLDYIYQKAMTSRHLHYFHGRRTFLLCGSVYYQPVPQKSRDLRHYRRDELAAQIGCLLVS